MKKLLMNKKTHYFLGGVVATLLVPVIAKSPIVRDTVVRGIAKGMEIQAKSQLAYENMKEDAQDLYYEARMEANQKNVVTADEPKEEQVEVKVETEAE